MTDPDMGYWTYQYDAVGNLTTQTDAKGQVLGFNYDQLNRLTDKRQGGQSGTVLASYTYDQGTNAVGRRNRMDDTSGYTTWTYDVRGRVTQETKVINGTGGGTFVTQYGGYNAMDRLTWMRYPGGTGGQTGEQVNFTYNNASQLSSVIGATPYVQSTTYDAAGRVDYRVLGSNVVQQDYVYYPWTTVNGQGRLQQLKTGVPGNLTSLQDLRYTYDAVGNVLTIQDWKAGSPQQQTFHYDALDRLKDATASGGTGGTYGIESYAYNPIGNLTSKAGVTQWYSDTLHKHAVTHLNTVRKFWYDANGNMTTRNDSTGNFTQQWDRENRLTGVSGSASATFVYDGDGNRVKATLNGVTTAYLGNYYEQSGSAYKKYYYAGGTRIAMSDNGTVKYLLGDHLGSTSLVANSSGGLSAEQRYKPWGENRYTNGTTPTRLQYTGQRNDSEIGLYFYNARFYSSALGRFISADTVVPDSKNPQAWNRYAYVVNNPLKYNDPTGHCFFLCAIIGGAIGAIGGAIGYTAHVITTGSGWDSNAYWTSVGIGAGAGAAVGGTLGVVAPAVPTAATAACADGDCTNEAQGAANLAQKAVSAVSADGDPTNEVRSLAAPGVNGTQFEVLNSQTIEGATRAAHRATANNGLASNLQADPGFRQQFNGLFNGQDVLAHMQSGSGALRNPPGAEWHHPVWDPNSLYLLRTAVHRAPELQDILHPGGSGGYAQYYGH